jgi:hypothetical protein
MRAARRLLALGWQQRLRGKRRKGGAGDAGNPPLGQHLCAELVVEGDRRRIPVQYCPFEPPAAALHREPGKVDQKRAAVASPAKFRPNE